MITISNHAKDLTGLRVGRLKALWPAKRAVAKSGAVAIKWMCGCECGSRAIVWASDLLRKDGPSTSCGCVNREWASKLGSITLHGRYGDYRYEAWRKMIARCTDPTHDAFSNYGARGITVCDRWLHGEGGVSGLECFISDLGERPYESATLERLRNNEGYSPDNCSWGSRTDQIRNRRNTVVVTAFGRTGPLATFIDPSDKKTYCRIAARIARGESAESAISGPDPRV